MRLDFKYYLNNQLFNLNVDLTENVSKQDDNVGLFIDFNDENLKVKVYPKKEIVVEDIRVSFDNELNDDDRIFFNGYSDWTYSYEADKNTINYGLNKVPLKFLTLKKFFFDRYGDYNFADYPAKNGYNHGWSYLYIRNGLNYVLYGSLNEDFAFTRFIYDNGLMSIVPDIKGYTTSNSFVAINICILAGNENEVFDKYFELLNVPKPTAEPAIGYTSWYNHYQNISEEIIDNDLKGIKSLPSEINMFQIDDGWETYIGDWLDVDTNKFKNGLKPVVDNIHDNGYKAGLWLAPFSAEKKSKLFNEHPDWFVLDKDGKPYECGSNWSSFCGLDIYKVEVRQYLSKVFDTVFNVWDFDLVKLDFVYSACILPRSDKPRGMIMADGMKLLRELCKDKLILGCGVPCASAFGRVDYCRIGPDVSLSYDDAFYMQNMHLERNSTKHTMINSIYRRQLDGRAFLNDPDVFILRDDNVKLTKEEKEKLATINGLFGSVLFMSDDASKYSDEQKTLYSKVISLKDNWINVELNNNIVTVEYIYNDNKEKVEIAL